jgi:hypothetical protein
VGAGEGDAADHAARGAVRGDRRPGPADVRRPVRHGEADLRAAPVGPDAGGPDLRGGDDEGRPVQVRPQWIGGGETRNGAKWMSLGQKARPSDASIYETRTAGSKGAGRGYTPSIIHASEVAHWEDPEFKVGLMESLPTLPETIAVFESTANGFNDFHTMWQRAVEGAEDEDLGGYYAPLFFGWQDNPAYARQFASDQARDRFERTVGDDRRRRRPGGGGARGGVRPVARAALLAPHEGQRAADERRPRQVPPGVPGDAGAGVHRVRPAGVPGHPRRPRDPGGGGGPEGGGGRAARRGLAGPPDARRVDPRPAPRRCGCRGTRSSGRTSRSGGPSGCWCGSTR